MAKKKIKSIQERIKEKQIENELKKKYKIEDDKKVVIEKKSFFTQILIFLQTSLIKLIKALFFIAIAIFSSIGFTVLINQPLRDLFLDMIQKSFF